MTHPIVALQAALVAALRTDPDLVVFDAPGAGRAPPYVTIARHDLLPRDGDDAPGYEHRLLLHAWTAEPSRKAVLTLAEGVVATALTATLEPAGLVMTLRRHERTDTGIEPVAGHARAAIALTFFTEPG